MKGTVYKRVLPSGTVAWAYSVYLGRDEGGKVTRKFKGGFATKTEADNECNQVLNDLRNGLPVQAAPKILRQFLYEWLSHKRKGMRCGEKTTERYQELLGYLDTALLNRKLSDITPRGLELEYDRLRESGGHDRKTKTPRPLSPRTVRHVHNTLRAAFNTAVRWRLLRENPAATCDLPPVEKKEAKALDPDQLEWYLDAARGHWLYPILLVASATSDRRGEVLALSWPDFHYVGADLPPGYGVLEITKSLQQTKAGLRVKRPKNGKPRRVVIGPATVAALEDHRSAQGESRRLFGKDYRSDLDLIFADPRGNYLKPDSVTATACRIARKAGLEGVGLHSLRHSHGSILLSKHVPLATVSKRLGHSSVNITAGVYAHSFRADEIAAAEAWENVMHSATKNTQLKQ